VEWFVCGLPAFCGSHVAGRGAGSERGIKAWPWVPAWLKGEVWRHASLPWRHASSPVMQHLLEGGCRRRGVPQHPETGCPSPVWGEGERRKRRPGAVHPVGALLSRQHVSSRPATERTGLIRVCAIGVQPLPTAQGQRMRVNPRKARTERTPDACRGCRPAEGVRDRPGADTCWGEVRREPGAASPPDAPGLSLSLRPAGRNRA